MFVTANAMEVKRFLEEQQAVFFLGTTGTERYNLLRGALHEPWRNLFFQESFVQELTCPIVFFPAIDQQALLETTGGDVWFLNTPYDRHNWGQQEWKTIFFPVRPELVLNGFVFVMPPSIGRGGDVFGTDALLCWSEEKIWKIVWIDVFPYAEFDEIQCLKHLRQFQVANLTVCLLQSGRRFGYSDSSDEQVAIDLAMNEYKSQGLCQFVHRLQPELDRSTLLQLLFERKPYRSQVVDSILQEMQGHRRNFERYFDEEFQELIINRISVHELDDLFAYSEWVRGREQNVFNYWCNRYSDRFDWEWRNLYRGLITKYAEPIAIEDPTEQTETLVTEAQRAFLKELETVGRQVEPVAKNISQLDYLAQHKDKTRIKVMIAQFLHKELKEKIRQFLSDQFKVWDLLR